MEERNHTSQKEYDVIIVGLGCFGLGAAYYCSKQRLSVIGFDKAHEPGVIGSGSVGHGRIWRYLHNESRYFEMQKESEEIFKEIEKKNGSEILASGGLLYIKKIGHPDLREFEKYGERISAQEIRKRWPHFLVPDYLEGVFTTDAGVVKVKTALTSFKSESQKLGADLRYNSNVAQIDHASGIISLDNGQTFKGKHIVVTCGATTDQFYQKSDQFKARKQLIHCYYLSEKEGLPPAFLMEDLQEAGGMMVFGTLDGENLTTYKVGNECDDIDPHLQLKIMRKIMPRKIEKIVNIQACFYSMSHDDEFIFERHGNTVYGFGCNGRGFKHMPYHGKRIYHLIQGNQKEANKYKKITAQSYNNQGHMMREPLAKL